MKNIVQKVRQLQKKPVAKKVKEQLLEFESFKRKSGKQWFSELCFCILTANSRAETAIKIQETLGAKGFCEAGEIEVMKCIREEGHRFHNNKAKFIVRARKHLNVKGIVKEIAGKEGEQAARKWLVENVKGLGYKEASHFLRNAGFKNFAILDRHILNLMLEEGLIGERPKTLGRKKYLEIEEKFLKLAKELKMPGAELDLFMWYMKTGKVLK